MADIQNEFMQLCVDYKVQNRQVGQWDDGFMIEVIMADGAKRSFPIYDDSRHECFTAAFNWVVTRLEDGDEGLR